MGALVVLVLACCCYWCPCYCCCFCYRCCCYEGLKLAYQEKNASCSLEEYCKLPCNKANAINALLTSTVPKFRFETEWWRSLACSLLHTFGALAEIRHGHCVGIDADVIWILKPIARLISLMGSRVSTFCSEISHVTLVSIPLLLNHSIITQMSCGSSKFAEVWLAGRPGTPLKNVCKHLWSLQTQCSIGHCGMGAQHCNGACVNYLGGLSIRSCFVDCILQYHG